MSSDTKPPAAATASAADKDAENDQIVPDTRPPHPSSQGVEEKGGDSGATPGDPNETLDEEPSSPGLDVHAVLGVPRPKRPSDRSEQAEEEDEDSDTDDNIDSDDDTEEWQEGEYFVIEEDDEELKELQTQMLSENASLSRDILVPIFTACCSAYDKWISEKATTTTEEKLKERHTQLQLYRKVLELYGSDVQWQGLTHAQPRKPEHGSTRYVLKSERTGSTP